MSDEKDEGEPIDPPPQEIVDQVLQEFMLFFTEDFDFSSLDAVRGETSWKKSILAAEESLLSVINAASLPYQMVVQSQQQRHFDRLLAAERIRNLKIPPPGEEPPKDPEGRAVEVACPGSAPMGQIGVIA